MARSHAKVLTEIWRKPEWLSLAGESQRLYLLMLSQPKLSLVGVLDYMPQRWTTFSSDGSMFDVREGMDELVRGEFVVLDDDTDEVLIRSFMKHDLTPARFNVNLVKGVWSAWGAVASPYLRSYVAHLIPDAVWDVKEPEPPADALHMRRSPRLERPVDTDRSDGPMGRADATTCQPSTATSQPSSVSDSDARDTREGTAQCGCVNGNWLDGEGQAHRCEHGLRVVS